jgi:hypothetical protein
MTERRVTIGLVTYTDVSGARRIGQQGETVQVHADDVERFDTVNGTVKKAPSPAKKAAPRRKR